MKCQSGGEVSLYLLKHILEVVLQELLATSLDEGMQSASCPGHFAPRKGTRAPNRQKESKVSEAVRTSSPTGYRRPVAQPRAQCLVTHYIHRAAKLS
jgi:hypothetical protein